jgi:hypothetical protein
LDIWRSPLFAFGTSVGHPYVTYDLQFGRYVFKFLPDDFSSDRHKIALTLGTEALFFCHITYDFLNGKILKQFLTFGFWVPAIESIYFLNSKFLCIGKRFLLSFIEQIQLSFKLTFRSLLTGTSELLLAKQDNDFRQVIDLFFQVTNRIFKLEYVSVFIVCQADFLLSSNGLIIPFSAVKIHLKSR